MSKENKIEKVLFPRKIVPVIQINNPKLVVPLCESLIDGGLDIIEITFRTEFAAAALNIISSKYPNIHLLAGTVMSVDQVRLAHDCGVDLVVTPGLNEKVINYCLLNNISIIPGVMTPTDIINLLDYDLKYAKFFPAEQAGGIPMLKALSGPFPNIKFIPTGGINESNLKEYLLLDNVVSCGGSWIASYDLLIKHDFIEITLRAKKAVMISKIN